MGDTKKTHYIVPGKPSRIRKNTIIKEKNKQAWQIKKKYNISWKEALKRTDTIFKILETGQYCFTVTEVSKLCKVHEKTVRRWTNQFLCLPSVKIRSCTIIPLNGLLEHVECGQDTSIVRF